MSIALLLCRYCSCFGVFACFFILPVTANQYRDVGDPIATVYSIEEHQSGSQVWWIEQLIDGQMVFATANGMTSWDGENWQQTSTPSNTRIRALTIWKDGHIYAGATNELGYFTKLDNGTFVFVQIPSAHLISQFGQSRSVNSNNTMVAYNTDEGVFVWNGQVLAMIDKFEAAGSRIFNIDGQLLINDDASFYQISLSNDNKNLAPSMIKKPWQVPPNTIIKSLFVNAKQELIMVTNMQGLFRLDNNQFVQVVNPTELPINALNSGIQGKDGLYYINSTINGIMVLSEDFELLRHFQQNDGLGLATTYDIFQDRQDNIWLVGLPNISVFQPPHLRSQYRNDTGTLDFENIYHIAGKTYFSGTGFYELTYPVQHYKTPTFKQIPNFDLVVLDIVAVNDELFVGTEKGVYVFEFNPLAKDSVIGTPVRITSPDFVSDFAVTPDNTTVFVSIGNHLSKLEKIQHRWQETKLLEDKSSTEYLAIEPLTSIGGQYADYAVWVSTDARDLYRWSPSRLGKGNADIVHFPKQQTPLGHEHVLPFFYQNTVMFGTENGIYGFQQDATPMFALLDWMPSALKSKNKDVFKALEDTQGRLWYHAGRDTGVTYQNASGDWVSQENIFKPYNRSGTRGLAYANEAIWFGVTNGSVYRMSHKVIDNIPSAASVSVRYIHNIDDDEPFTLMENDVAIESDRNSIRIGYALPDYSSTKQTQYRTRISGHGNANWTLWSNEASKDFPLLNGGDYIFAIEAMDSWGRTSRAQYDFSVEYPWYLNTYARVVYGLALLLLVYASVKLGQLRRNQVLQAHNTELERRVEQRTDEINNKVAELKELQTLKDRFFANVSHEFRTPLTLTIGPLQEMVEKHRTHIGKESLHLSLTALSNAKKMLALVGQVLDINRLELGNQSLRIAEYDIASLLRANASRFAPWAEQHQQVIECINCENPFLIFCDQDQIDKCVSNLLSNAIKYSGDGTLIKVALLNADDKIGIQVSDNGVGLPPALKDLVFERFYQADLNDSDTQQGSGIGLHLVKEIVCLHRGDVELLTQVNQGCQFTIWMLKGNEHFTAEDLIEPMYVVQSDDLPSIPSYDLELDKATVLIIDDNPSLRQFMSQVLSTNYQILCAENAEQGLASALKYLPDVIVSDVSMPGMSGLTLTEKLKKQPDTRAIPVLLLSAQTSKRDIVAGFSSGANDYLIKPFDTSELIMRINALLQNYKGKLALTIDYMHISKRGAGKVKSFEDKLNQAIMDNISDNKFTIESLAKSLFMSSETLRRKCHQLVDMSPISYVQQKRLEEAKYLLETQELNVSEVAYTIGFDSLAYFSRSFKKYYGVSPSRMSKKR